MKWQPIADAPRDGTDILLTDGHFVCAGCYRKGVIHFECERCGWADEQDDNFPWIFFDGGFLNGWHESTPTHFMRLPSPPDGLEEL